LYLGYDETILPNDPLFDPETKIEGPVRPEVPREVALPKLEYPLAII
jgi:hypothetical protein